MSFLGWLAALSILFVVLERLNPWRREQHVYRKDFWKDLFYLFLNGHLVGIALAFITPSLLYLLDRALEPTGLSTLLSMGIVSDWPFWGQFLVAFFAVDFLQWCIHNLLHRVPFLWEFHKTHHSIVTMDWMGHMRFHWVEGLIYKSLLFVPLTLLDIQPEVFLVFGVFTLGVGYFNHSNFNVDIGPLGFFFNNPRMHLWHHTHPSCGPVLCNFALNLSLWDWLFRTAYLPRGIFPEEIGLATEDRFPDSLWEQLVYPLRLRKGRGDGEESRRQPA